MDNLKNNTYYLRKMAKDIVYIIEKTKNISLEKLEEDETLRDSMLFRLIQISENSLRLTPEFKRRYEEIPWQAIKGMRNRIVHEYGDVDMSIVYETITKDIPALYEKLESLL